MGASRGRLVRFLLAAAALVGPGRADAQPGATDPPPQAPAGSDSAPGIACGFGGAVSFDGGVLVQTLEASAGLQASGLWWHARAGLGSAHLVEPAGSGFHDSGVFELRSGPTFDSCRRRGCRGLSAELGFQHATMSYIDGDVLGDPWTETRDAGLLDLRIRGQLCLRSEGRLAIEATLGARSFGVVHQESWPGAFSWGLGVGAGLVSRL